jgi:hypothetical protein
VPAEPRHLRRGLRFGMHPSGSRGAGEQFPRLLGGQHVEDQQLRPLGGHHARQAVPARDEHQAVRACRHQGPHLLGGRGVVQHHEAAAAREQAAVAGCLLLHAGRERIGRYAEGAEEPVERLGGREALSGFVAVQVHVELGVGKCGPQHMRQVNGQGRLSHPGSPGDDQRDDRFSR